MPSQSPSTLNIDVTIDPASFTDEDINYFKANRGRILFFPEGMSDNLTRVVASYNTILSSFVGQQRKLYIDALHEEEEVPSKRPIIDQNNVPALLARKTRELFEDLSDTDQDNFVQLLSASSAFMDQLEATDEERLMMQIASRAPGKVPSA